MGMKIYNLTPYQYNFSQIKQNGNISSPSFKALISPQKLTHCNIGMLENGTIGNVNVIKNGKETLLNVVKSAGGSMQETYMLKDAFGKIIGEMDIKIVYNNGYGDDVSHVFVEHLANYSRPATKDFRTGLVHHNGVGTRLLQIAQRRSDECGCRGEIYLHSKEEAVPFYEKLGFQRVPAAGSSEKRGHNKMYLPPSAKEPLSMMNGGL